MVQFKDEDWMMTEADVSRLRNRLYPSLEARNIADDVRFEIAQKETWEAFMYIPQDLCSWRTMKSRLEHVCAECGLDPMKVVDTRYSMPLGEADDERLCYRFTLPNILMTTDVARNYVSYCDRMRKARKGGLVSPPLWNFSEPWRRIDFQDDDGAVYEDGVILPKQDPNATDLATIALSPEFLVYHQDEGGFGENRDYTPYYAKKLLTRPIKRVKINYGHQGNDESKNLWVIYELEDLLVRIAGKETSPYRADGTLKTRADYGTDAPIENFWITGHKILAGRRERYLPDWTK